MDHVLTNCKDKLAALACHYVDEFRSNNQHFTTLKFRCGVTEDAYARHVLHEMRSSIRIVCAVIMLFSIFCTGNSLREMSSSPSKQQSNVLTVILIAWVSAFCLSTLAFLIVSPTRAVSPHFATEKITLLLVLLAFLVVLLTDRVYVTRLAGFDFLHVWGRDADDSDTRILLNLDVVMTVTHIMLPIRWYIVVITEFSGFFTYIIAAFGIGSHSDAVLENIVCLFGLTVLASIGKRTVEIIHRRNFKSIIREKTKAAAAEFKLSRATDGDSTSDSSKEVSTCDTSTLVSSVIFGDEQIQLSNVRRIGKAEQWLVDEKDIKFAGACTLGIGASASVQRACYHSASVAVKHCKPEANTQKTMLLLCNELRILRRLRHPNIVNFYGAIVDFESFTISLVIELALGPSLQTLIDGGNRAEFIPTMRERIVILSAICGVLSYLHTRSPVVVHGDLAPSNVQVERVMDRMRGWVCNTKLLDFGLSRVVTKRARPLGGTLQWVAPEVFQQNNVLTALPKACDIYSFGRIAYTFFTGARDVRNEGAILRALRRGDVAPLIWPITALQNKFTSKCVPILDRCCLPDASARPDIAEVHQVFMTLIDEGIEELATDGVDTNKVSL
eukprot:TRINITY_DN12029_c0_g1_i3.p1 TRINITY_DN12029_c0_g1~~TRINITY_DN12029_c0_g1_i3.p1  ORF type:complete len:650 (+),score=60.98 TRINITY_DN12029_c0_g1_i3:110-1951(+)